MAMLFLIVLICLWISHHLGLWDSAKTGVGNFGSIGYFTDDPTVGESFTDGAEHRSDEADSVLNESRSTTKQ